MSTGLAAEPSRASPSGPPSGRRRPAPWVAVAALFAVACGIYVVLALSTPLPVLFPDELRYAHLARAIADGRPLAWRGEPINQTATLYVYFLAPLWALWHSTVDAYHASKVAGTLALCAQVFPVWLIGREVAGRTGALVAAALSVAGTWMLTTAGLVTEVLALPLGTAALCAAVAALRRPGSLWWLGALILAGLATWARIQMAVLVPALLVAFLLDVVRQRERRGERLRAHMTALIALGALTALLVGTALAAPSVTGDYAGFFHLRPPLGRIIHKTALQLAELVAVGGLVPVLLAAGAAGSRSAWRDERTGPLLAVFWPAAVVFVAQSGIFLAGFPAAISGIQRYVVYPVPIALLLLVVLAGDRRLLLRRSVLGIAAVGAVLMLWRPAIAMMGEERAAWSTSYRLHQLLGVGTGAGLALLGLLLVAGVALIARRIAAPPRAVAGAAAVVFALFLVQDQAAWQQMTSTASAFRTQLPPDLEWIDHQARGPVAMLALTQNAPQYEDLEFFNRDIAAIYVPPGGLPGRPLQGHACVYRFGPRGELTVEPGCGPMPSRFFLPDPAAAITFHDEVRSVRDPRVGRIATLQPGLAPRAEAVLILACPRPSPVFSGTSPRIVSAAAPRACNTTVTGALWLDQPAQVVVRYRGGSDAHAVTAAGRRYVIAPHAAVTIRFPAAAGASRFTLEQDWTSSGGAPTLAAAGLVSGGRTTPIL